ncbi:MAG: hypothetical protein M1818_000510 [Claussenomyces sp. TS43310]|nr:MAG: hypothetical protein M1818_000510 [Claussenomyces sp. TS43310]
MHAQVEQQLAYILLTELLAHQFASPVQWIETQDVLLGQQNAERFIEIGPSDTLTSMTKKTIARKYQNRDAARHMNRKLLYYSKNAREIQYDEEEGLKAVPTRAKGSESASKRRPEGKQQKNLAKAPEIQDVKVEVRSNTAPECAPGTSAVVSAAHTVADVALSAEDIIVTITAQKLKKSFKDVDTKKTIKQLVGGRSTLENEIIGDLGAEFGSTPERAEEMALESLVQSLQSSPSFSSQMGKPSMAIVARMFSLSMPGGFSIATARDYLQSRWGLQPGRQSSVLLRAGTVQINTRLADLQEAHKFLDGVAQQYASEQGLNLSAPDTVSSAAVAVAVAVDSKALDAVVKDKEALRQAKLELYAKFLGRDLRADAEEALKVRGVADALQLQLDALSAELGDVFSIGILPRWAALKIRRFDSNWNWVLQDTLEVFHGALLGRAQVDLSDQSLAIANRSNPRLLRMMRHLMEHLPAGRGIRSQQAKSILSQLIRLCEATPTPRFKPVARYTDSFITGPRTTIDGRGRIQYKEVARPAVVERAPPVHIKTKGHGGWTKNKQLTSLYLDLLDDIRQDGMSFSNKYILLTGASPGSIGAEILRGLLSGGGRVVVTTSNYSFDTIQYYQKLYVKHGSRGSELIVAPFNQGSQQDLEALVEYIFDPTNGLGWNLDHVIPFAAISESGREIDNLDSKSELAHRIMLTNTLRLLGAIKRQKESRGYHNRPAQVILPLSPNHGAFGNDGLYGESKIALETLFERWHSESWSAFLSICGAVIGWTRGTGLMADNNLVAAGIERVGVRTFSQAEMAYYVLALMSRKISIECDLEPIHADLTGGLSAVSDLKKTLAKVRQDILEESDVLAALTNEDSLDSKVVTGGQLIAEERKDKQPRANIRFDFPRLPDYKEEVEPLSSTLKGMVDLDRVVVVTGFSEVGPHGNARTRWEMEANGHLSLEGCIEMAWIMGLIKNHNGPIDGKHYTGWVDTKTNKPVHDIDVKAKYETHILNYTGIRLIEPELDEGYQPEKKQFLQEIILEQDLPPLAVPKELAEQMAHEHGDKTSIYPGGDDFMVQLKKGATIMVPKALSTNRTVAGQVPTGWDARTYGISDDIISQVDRSTLYTLVSAVEAFVASGVTDPYEFYQYIHVSEVGNCIGSGFGAMHALKRVFKSRYLDQPVQSDILQESFINTTAAWVNMLLVSSSGPIRTPVGACATSIESLETGFETIVSGKAKMCLVGGYDDMTEAVSYEFGNMKATSDGIAEAEKGRLPQDMSRPNTTTRSGFMESQGSGVQTITSARLALDMGLPINGIVAWVGTASDKIGRSVPAPGKGILTNARETNKSGFPSPLLDIEYRKQRLDLRMKCIQECLDAELKLIEDEVAMLPGRAQAAAPKHIQHRTDYLVSEAQRQRRDALNTFGNEFWKMDPSISPIRGSLAVWGLTIEDLGFASLHGTSTVKNDQNETGVIQHQLAHMGREPGNPLLCITQKYLTGHSKGAAGAWMLNGCLQVLETGIVPGNRNADNVDSALAKNDMLVFPNRSIQTAGMKAFTLTSFGFGQKGAQAIGVHPKYLYATLHEHEFRAYQSKVGARHRKAFRFFHNALATNTMFVAKDAAPYRPDQEASVLLNPEARVSEPSLNVTEYLYADGHIRPHH